MVAATKAALAPLAGTALYLNREAVPGNLAETEFRPNADLSLTTWSNDSLSMQL